MAYKEIYTKPDGGIPDSDIASASAWNNKVPSTRKVNDKALSSDIALTASDVGALPTSGGSLTGNLTVGFSSIGTNGYIEGTWLKTTKATESAGNFATISGDGWIYKRAPANVLSDIGGQAKITANGILKGDGKGNITAADSIDLPIEHISNISLPTASWKGSDPYTQTVTISGSTANTKVDIQPSEEIYDQLVADNVGYLAIKNVDGTLTAVAKGGKPSVDLTVQVTYNDVF